MNKILTVTDKATIQLEKIIQSAPSDTVGILIGVDKTGCNGYSYKLDFAKQNQVEKLERKVEKLEDKMDRMMDSDEEIMEQHEQLFKKLQQGNTGYSYN